MSYHPGAGWDTVRRAREDLNPLLNAMTPTEAFLLGLIQGITEFLPISSSAHLILVPYLFGWDEHSLRFDVITNAGTLLAAVVYFRRDLVAALRDGLVARPNNSLRPGLLGAILLASLPVLGVGFVFYDWFATGARNPLVIAIASIFFGLVLWWSDRRAPDPGRGVDEVSWKDSVWIGCAQALALIPGTSRSGITITAGWVRGLSRSEAARFSLLLAIPVGSLAFLKDLFQIAFEDFGSAGLQPLVIGFLTSAVSAYLVIGWLLRWLERQSTAIFVIYRIALGGLILALSVWR